MMQSNADSHRDDTARFLLAMAASRLRPAPKDGRPLTHGIPGAWRLGLVHPANAATVRAKTAREATGAITAAPRRCTSRRSRGRGLGRG